MTVSSRCVQAVSIGTGKRAEVLSDTAPGPGAYRLLLPTWCCPLCLLCLVLWNSRAGSYTPKDVRAKKASRHVFPVTRRLV